MSTPQTTNSSADRLLEQLSALKNQVGSNDEERDEIADAIELKKARLRAMLSNPDLTSVMKDRITSALQSAPASDMSGSFGYSPS